MPTLLKSKKQPGKDEAVFGLDIGASSIKLVKIKTAKDKTEFCDFRIEPVPSPARLAQVLAAVAQAFSIKNAVVSVSGDSTIIRYIALPTMSAGELKQVLKFEAQKYIPFSVDEVYIDAHILKQGLPDNKMLTIVAAVKKDFLNQRLGLVKEANIQVSAVDIDSLALINAFNFNHASDEGVKNKTVALLNIGASLSNVSILEEGLPRLSRDIRIGGNNFTQNIAAALGLDIQAAEQLKQRPDAEAPDTIKASIEACAGQLAKEIRTSFDYYESQSVSSVTKIFLSGGGSVCKGLKEALAVLLGIEVSYWNVIKKIDIASSLDAGRLDKLKDAESIFKEGKGTEGICLSNQLAVAFGLALR